MTREAPDGARPLLVAKIGGSLHASPDLARWIEALRRWPHRLTLVAGGGPFADAVRAAQARWGFGDADAHHLALLAMEQYGRMLCALAPELVPADTPETLRAARAAGRRAVWLPAAMALADPDIPRDWSMTSDALAAWLAGRLGARGLVLVKSAPLPRSGSRPLAALCAGGLVDSRLEGYARAAGVPVRLLGPDARAALPRVLAGEAGAGLEGAWS